MKKEYRIEVSPEVLELLRPSLYTNIYYVLAELIANGYDADATNVWVGLNDKGIYVEDDGHGMSYSNNEIQHFLAVAQPSRTANNNEFTKRKRRPRMGRKGVGKLAALSVSEEVNVYSIKDGEKSGFVLSRHVPEDHLLRPIPEDQIKFAHVSDHGTRIEMLNPQYHLPKQASTVVNNLAKFFPQVGPDFQIHVEINKKTETLIDSQKYLSSKLDTLTTFGEGFTELQRSFVASNETSDFLKKENEVKLDVEMADTNGKMKKLIMNVTGWIGTYKSTRGQKKNQSDFPDNYVAVYSHGKLGQFNTLSEIGKNRLSEVYLVGEFFVDEFEDSQYPDMALSNRQGYKTDDPRYKVFSAWLEKTVKDAVSAKQAVVKERKRITEEKKRLKQIQKEADLRKSVDQAIDQIDSYVQHSSVNPSDIQDEKRVVSTALETVGLKKLETQKQMRKILISQTEDDVVVSNCIYSLLLFNGFNADDILYTNSEDESSHIPWGMEIYEYLRQFFAQSFTNKPLFVIYIDSDSSPCKRGVQMEIGAGWVSQTEYDIVKCGKSFPLKPLNTDKRFAEIRSDQEGLFLTSIQFSAMYEMIKHACQLFDITPHSQEENKVELSKIADIVDVATFNSRVG
ncbi:MULTISPECIES: ATP-binding protein [Lacticaseibacillus]|uniref:ATP-binding protein n=1 Tax=Lacticaseibacillus TaxID=2759736 RepID=UPI00069A5A6D|nr:MULTISPECIES: ATP-binding protein [Lacticaseibacillus]